jgi:hypothetical protein
VKSLLLNLAVADLQFDRPNSLGIYPLNWLKRSSSQVMTSFEVASALFRSRHWSETTTLVQFDPTPEGIVPVKEIVGSKRCSSDMGSELRRHCSVEALKKEATRFVGVDI